MANPDADPKGFSTPIPSTRSEIWRRIPWEVSCDPSYYYYYYYYYYANWAYDKAELHFI